MLNKRNVEVRNKYEMGGCIVTVDVILGASGASGIIVFIS